MKTFALIATSLTLLSAGTRAQEAAAQAPTVKVTTGTVVTLYSIAPQTGKLNISCTGGITSDPAKKEMRLDGDVHGEYGKSFDIYAGKTLIKTLENGTLLITLQSDGKIESLENGHKVTQFVADGTTIELLSSK